MSVRITIRADLLPTPISKADKVKHVLRARQTRVHHCHWNGCLKQVAPALWGCYPHWMRLPKALRDRIWAAYVPGQENRGDPSESYLKVAREVRHWIRQRGGKS